MTVRFIPRHKFNAVRTEFDGKSFSSKREANYYSNLKMRMREGGDVVFFLWQVPFHLPGNVVYRCDFQVFLTNGEVHFVDAKGFKTESYKAKKRMVESLYAVKIEEV